MADRRLPTEEHGGSALAQRWRIRHKLTLGLALVVGIMALLLGGTLKGLLSYRTTMKSMNSKLEELKAAQRLHETIDELANAVDDSPHSRVQLNYQHMLQLVPTARSALAAYRLQLGETMQRGRDADNGYSEMQLVSSIDQRLGDLERQARADSQDAQMISSEGASRTLDPALAATLTGLKRDVLDLRETVHTDIRKRIDHSRKDYYFSIALAVCTTVLGVIFLLTLARLSYRWVVDPIRDLHEKVGHLAQGNFESRIEVKSGDEMQDLAEAFNDMTARLQGMYSDLARQVNERSRQLVRSEKLAGIGFLAAGVAHEINNPLASIAFAGESLERRLFKNGERGTGNREHGHGSLVILHHSDEATVKNYLKMIQDEAFRCKNITQKLLEFSRVGERQKTITDLAELVQSVIDMVQHHQSYKEKHIVFVPRQQPKAVVNAEEIKSVVLNLVVNALDSMEAGGRLAVGMDVHDQMAVLTFTDSGCGMSAEVLDNIFEPFFTRSRTGKGVGLGLSISHRIVTQHGGEIEAASPGANRGSTFTLRLPLRPRESEARPLARAA
jgi:signal transduction histidine kinase